MLRTGIAWRDWPFMSPSSATCKRRLQDWREAGVFGRLLLAIGRELELASEPCYIDASFNRARGGGEGLGLTRHGKGVKLQVLCGSDSIPRAFALAPAGLGETSLSSVTLDSQFAGPPVRWLLADRAYDSNPWHASNLERGISSWAPRLSTRKTASLRDEGLREHYPTRFSVERLFAWLAAWRRLATRYERDTRRYQAWVELALALTLARRARTFDPRL